MVIYTKFQNSYNVSMSLNLSEWLQKKYIQWMAKHGEIRSQREFAEYLGIDKVSMSRYMNAKIRNPDMETIQKFAEKLGPEVYDVLGLARPDPQLQELTSMWHTLDQETKDRILAIARSE